MTDSMLDLCRATADRAKAAARLLANTTGAQRNRWLTASATAIRERADALFEANARDLEAAPSYGLTSAAIDRLRLTRKGIDAMCDGLAQVAALPDPIGEVTRGETRPNGLRVAQVRVPIGVVFMIFESRPNVTVDAAALCVKSGNAAILRGGKEAFHTNLALHRVITSPEVIQASGIPTDAVQLVETTDRDAVGHFLRMPDRIDLAIPRGGESLIRRVVAEAEMPVLKHYNGVCHVFIDASADLGMAVRIVENSKVQRPGVCNAAETLLVHRDAADLLPTIAARLMECGVELRGDERSRELVPSMKSATEDDWAAEYLDLILAVRVVDGLDEAMEHIARYGSAHTDAIVTSNVASAEQFIAGVDSAAVLVNASTRFNDGAELGLGAEIGISTDKIHARGPCGLRELTSTKWIVRGDGHIRE